MAGETYRHVEAITILRQSDPEPALSEPAFMASPFTLRLSIFTKFRDVAAGPGDELHVTKNYGSMGLPAQTWTYHFPLAGLASDRLLFHTLSVANFDDVARYLLDYALQHRSLDIEARADVFKSWSVDQGIETFPECVDREEEEELGTCPVCLEDIFGGDYLDTPCLHFYHEECILRWLEKSSTCPMCREPVYI